MSKTNSSVQANQSAPQSNQPLSAFPTYEELVAAATQEFNSKQPKYSELEKNALESFKKLPIDQQLATAVPSVGQFNPYPTFSSLSTTNFNPPVYNPLPSTQPAPLAPSVGNQPGQVPPDCPCLKNKQNASKQQPQQPFSQAPSLPPQPPTFSLASTQFQPNLTLPNQYLSGFQNSFSPAYSSTFSLSAPFSNNLASTFSENSLTSLGFPPLELNSFSFNQSNHFGNFF